jgi:hypothetical protein
MANKKSKKPSDRRIDWQALAQISSALVLLIRALMVQ